MTCTAKWANYCNEMVKNRGKYFNGQPSYVKIYSISVVGAQLNRCEEAGGYANSVWACGRVSKFGIWSVDSDPYLFTCNVFVFIYALWTVNLVEWTVNFVTWTKGISECCP